MRTRPNPGGTGWFGAANGAPGVFAHAQRCTAVRARVPLASKGLAGPPVQWQQGAQLPGPRPRAGPRQVRAREARGLAPGRQDVPRSSIRRRRIEARRQAPETGKPIAYMEHDAKGGRSSGTRGPAADAARGSSSRCVVIGARPRRIGAERRRRRRDHCPDHPPVVQWGELVDGLRHDRPCGGVNEYGGHPGQGLRSVVLPRLYRARAPARRLVDDRVLPEDRHDAPRPWDGSRARSSRVRQISRCLPNATVRRGCPCLRRSASAGRPRRSGGSASRSRCGARARGRSFGKSTLTENTGPWHKVPDGGAEGKRPRAVLPRSQARPCYLAGVSRTVRLTEAGSSKGGIKLWLGPSCG